ncbi:DHA2 family efflux MFS transporter permease subunit [Streptomyces sp. SID1121]|uniref:DHA2 family efflux MFS transporter permease subunit n=1 Tax=Streptomyces sp. SID1121 TaxID=3425888 RepID=UPI004055EC00
MVTPPRKALLLALCCVSVLLIGIDMTGVNVALPTIGARFHAGTSALSWVVDAYTVTLAAFLLLASSAADRLGRRRIFVLGLAVFVVGSALCAVAPTLGWLIVFRVVQALGAAALNPVAMAIIGTVHTEPAERARALGVWGGVIGLSLALGPIVGGALVDSPAGWRWIFLINVPIGIAALLVTRRVVPESRSPFPRRFDPFGQVFVTTGLAALTLGIIEGPTLGWLSAPIAVAFAVAALCLTGLLLYEPRRAEPLIELGFFRSFPFAASSLTAVLSFAALGSFLFLNSLYLQQERGYSAFTSGLLVLPLAVAGLVLGPVGGRVLAVRGPRIPLAVAGTGIGAAGVMLSVVDRATPVWFLLLAYTVMGIGNAAVGAPVSQAAVAGMPRERIGVATGISSTSRQVGATLGVAVAGAVLAGGADGGTHGTRTAWWLNAGYGTAVLVLGLLSTTAWAHASARAVAGPPAVETGNPTRQERPQRRTLT